MSFKRVILPSIRFEAEDLTNAMSSIGFRLGGKPLKDNPNIEDVLVSASIEGILKPDYRVLSLLVDWVSVHGHAVNVDRLSKVIPSLENALVRAFWVAVARWQKRDPRWRKIAKMRVSGRLDLLEQGTDFLVSKHGEDERFKGTCLRVPRFTLRERREDILLPEHLASKNKNYFYRILIGPTYRADMWAYVDEHPDAEAANVARACYGSFTTAWTVKSDWLLLKKKAA